MTVGEFFKDCDAVEGDIYIYNIESHEDIFSGSRFEIPSEIRVKDLYSWECGSNGSIYVNVFFVND